MTASSALRRRIHSLHLRTGRPRLKPFNIFFPSKSPYLRASRVRLRFTFRIQQDLHINSHTPREDYLIPTGFSIPEASGVRLASASYPAGSDFTLPVDPNEKLLVYTGEFTIQAHDRRERRRSSGRSEAPLPGLRPECMHAAEDDSRRHRCDWEVGVLIPGPRIGTYSPTDEDLSAGPRTWGAQFSETIGRGPLSERQPHRGWSTLPPSSRSWPRSLLAGASG